MAAKGSTGTKASKKKPRKSSRRTSHPAIEIKGTGMRIGLGVAALAVTSLCLLFVLVLPPNAPQGGSPGGQRASTELQAQDEAATRTAGKAEPVKTEQAAPTEERSRSEERLYEESLQEDFQRRIREVDLALVQCLILQEIDPQRLHHEDVRKLRHGAQPYLHQAVTISLDEARQQGFLAELRTYLEDWIDGAELAAVTGREGAFQITVYGKPTHALRFSPTPPPGGMDGPDRPRLAIVIDDLGESMAKAKQLAAILGTGATWSILPHCTYTEEIVELASRKGIDVLLHLPMEPVSYPEVNPGPGSLFVSMDRQTIRSTLREDLRQIAGAVGVNNHMGSRFTEDEQGMRAVLSLLKERHLFFMDSLTNPESQARSLAGELGVPHVSRDIFIDNEQRVEAIVYQLQKAERLSRKVGQAVAIGHPYPETIEALRQWTAKRRADVELVRVGSMVHGSSRYETRTASRQSSTEGNPVW